MLRLADIVLATGGLLLQGHKETAVGMIATDTRGIAEGCFFVPLMGKRFDGHDFLQDAMRKGASGCLIRKGWPGTRGLPKEPAVVAVEDTHRAYGDIAAYYRRLFFDLTLVGLTGSNGKTTTKEMIHALLHRHARVLKTEATENNLIGVPKTLLRLNRDTRWAVAEMGTNRPGEIARLAQIAQPQMGLLTNIGPSHLEAFRDMRGVMEEKAALGESLPETGVLITHRDDPLAWEAASRSKARLIGFGWGKDCAIRAQGGRSDSRGRWSFDVTAAQTCETLRIALRVPGRHNANNALAAMAVGLVAGLRLQDMKQDIETFAGMPMRMQWMRRGGIEVLMDAYNANPASLARAMDVLDSAACAGKKVVVLGDMLELGGMEEQAHAQAGGRIASSKATVLVTVGERARVAADLARVHGHGLRVLCCADAAQAIPLVREQLRDGDMLLLKGSRGMKLETILEGLPQEQPARMGGECS